jgi:hypothetical protein
LQHRQTWLDRIVLAVADVPFLDRLWADVGGDPLLLRRVSISGPETVLPSVYDVTGWAAATIAVARLAAAELRADDGPIVVDRQHAAATFLAEALFEPDGWERPPVWDPIAGDYAAADGWVRLHTNYAAHRAAALSALGVGPDDVADAVRARPALDVEAAVVGAGGCAAALQAVRFPEPVVFGHGAGSGTWSGRERLRVLDLTRVIAGPECTRFLAAALGADVLRIDPPGFEEVPALLAETTAGKRCAFLDIKSERFDELLRDADVVVCGLRPDAVDAGRWRAINPSLVIARLDAYGWMDPVWRTRRGFDSLVQMTTGIAARGQEVYGTDRPTPLPAQALDHGAGFALAAGVCRALTALRTRGEVVDVFASLVGAANELTAFEVDDARIGVAGWPAELYEPVTTAWGPARRIRPVEGTLTIDPAPLGVADASWD